MTRVIHVRQNCPMAPDVVVADPPQPGPEIREAFRSFLLPVPPEAEDAAVISTVEHLDDAGVTADDQAAWLRLRLDDWRQSGTPLPELAAFVSAILQAHVPEIGALLAQRYFDVHRQLREKHLLPHEDASAFLTHAVLIARFGRHDFMSAAQVTRLLAARDGRLTFRWRAVQDVLRGLGLLPRMMLDSVKDLVATDEELEQSFADADIEVAAKMVGAIADRLGFPGKLDEQLICLCDRELHTFEPYLKILHYQCVVAAFFDHAVTNAYEFSPRGAIATWLCSRYPDALNNSGNPFLNNAKAVQQLDMAWAEGRDDKIVEARALARILAGMEMMGFAARREVSEWVRRWLHRVMRLHKDLTYVLPPDLTALHVRNVLGALGAAESHTKGVIEQRVIDALTSVKYIDPKWRPRGLGDSVNAANLPTRKIGDCDYQNASTLEIHAFESHGGRLTAAYLEEHLRGLRKTLRLRTEELRGIADPLLWQATVSFIAHTIDAPVPPPFNVDGVSVTVELMTMAEFVAQFALEDDAALMLAFNNHVHTQLNEPRTPNECRERYARLAGLP
jgi:hypothetical protein